MLPVLLSQQSKAIDDISLPVVVTAYIEPEEERGKVAKSSEDSASATLI